MQHKNAALVFTGILTVLSGIVHAAARPLPDFFYGVTIDDGWEGKIKPIHITDALKAMPVKPVVRIVMSAEKPPAEYKKLFAAIHRTVYIMATPVDSSEMKKYPTVSAYLKRFESSYQALAEYVDIWEIGNEINGENWLGNNPQFLADKAAAAYRYIRSKKAATALTTYYFAPNMQKTTMRNWLARHIPADMKQHVDYVFVSYYEDDNNGFQPDWKNVFNELQTLFPHAKLGIGECGNTRKNASVESKTDMIRHYYSMPKYTPNYVGGYFWWYWVQDSVPHQGNKVWEEISKHMKPHRKAVSEKYPTRN
ncbi:hypothetical protein [Neisseria animaloris]|uniref:hypothetical protein n=1 Tax=Neisseria animaloris TaxID=326522 RepID=UPI000D2FBEC5|nr:hypothetical protein [Neisseria animaloris]